MQTECRAVVFHGPDQPLQLRNFDVPAPAAGEAVVAIEACTICGSDLHTIAGKREEVVPTILGHEAVGHIVSLGSPGPLDVKGAAVNEGDRVTWGVATSCGECDRCRGRLPQKCRSVTKYGHGSATGRYALSGGMSERILLRAGTAICRLSAELPFEVAAPASCATSTVLCAIRNAGSLINRKVLVFGAGLLGLTAVAAVREYGAKRVAVCDVNVRRAAAAGTFGADSGFVAGDDMVKMQRDSVEVCGTAKFDVVLELSGASSAVEAAVEFADIGGTVVLVGSVFPARPIAIDPEAIVRRCLSIRGVHNYAPEDLDTAVRFLERAHQRYPFASLVERTFALEDFAAAIQDAREQQRIRVALRP